jgi:general secretion pathway protein H
MPSDRLRAGFTLIELLVVLVIIGIVIGSVGLSMDTGQGRAETEAKRVAALLTLAREEAVLTGNEYAVEFTARGYRFYFWRQKRWQAAADETFRERQLPADLQMALRLPDEPRPAASRLAGAGEAPARIYLLSSGEITPFELIVAAGADRPLYRIAGGARGGIVLEPVAGK